MPPPVFISYSHKDRTWKERLVRQLGVLQREGLLHVWHDGLISTGGDWLPEIESAMTEAGVAVLLVSADFLNSDFIRGREVPTLLKRRQNEGMRIFPVIVNPCPWQKVKWLAPIQALPEGDKTLADLSKVKADRVLSSLAVEILELVQAGMPATGAKARGRQPGLSGADLKASKHQAPLKASSVGTSEGSSWPSGTALPRLHQLPAPPADFTGRGQELQELRAAIVAGGATAIFGLHGMGGVGKTALALKLAEEVAGQYLDGQIYLDLKGVSTPLKPTQAMAWVVRSFQPEAPLPEDEAELAALYRSELHDKRVLLLMDNAANREQVEPLRPPAGCALLVTSRFHFSFSGLTTRDLDELSGDEAQKLLLRACPRIGAAAAELARVCGGLPLALSLASGALNERADLSPAAYARQLAKGRKRLVGVDASLDLSYRLIPENLQRLWRLLAVFPGTFDAAAAAAVWELDEDVTDEALGKLVTSSLLDWEERLGRYRLHDLARSFAELRLAVAERATACRRHAEHYLEILAQADELYLQGGMEIENALSLFDREWDNVKAGHAWAVEQPLEDPGAAGLSTMYPDAGVHCLALRLRAADRIQWLETAVAAARQCRDRGLEANHLGNLGIAYGDLGEPRRAIELHEQHGAFAREIGDRRSESNALTNLGNAYLDLGEPRRAIEHHEQALAIKREIGDRWGESYALGSLGLAYAFLGEPRRAIEFYEQRVSLSREFGDRKGESNGLGNLGLAYAALGEPHRAIDFYQQALAISREIGHRSGESNALGSLGIAYADLSEYERAIELYEQQLAISYAIGDGWGKVSASWNLGIIFERQGNLARAVQLMQLLVDLERHLGHPDADKHAAVVAAIRARLAARDPDSQET
jgi:tetratricopeptide (TPR) repeat protein